MTLKITKNPVEVKPIPQKQTISRNLKLPATVKLIQTRRDQEKIIEDLEEKKKKKSNKL